MADQENIGSDGRALSGIARMQAEANAGAGATCNALIQRGRGDQFCKMVAGLGTDHLGEGHCYMHGGRPVEANEAVPALAERVNKLSQQDQEALMAMGTKAMVLARARMMERLLLPGITTKEMQDITASVTRLDKLLEKHPELDDPDAAPNTALPSHLDDELKRLIALDK